jgi:hypothetical protein
MKFPFSSVTRSVNGRVRFVTVDVLLRTALGEGLKSIFGNVSENSGCAVAGVLKTPEPSARLRQRSACPPLRDR